MSTLIKRRATKRAPLPDSLKRLPRLITIPRMSKCTVANCFTDKSVFSWRDPNFNNLLPATLPASEQVSVRGYELTKITTEAKMAKIDKPFTNLKQIEDLILRTEKRENTGLITNGYSNIFFLQVGGSVFAVHAYRYSAGWNARLYHFSARGGWAAGRRFFSLAT